MKRVSILPTLVAMLIVTSSASAQTNTQNDNVVDTKFVVVASSLVASTIFDVETTFPMITNHGGREINPLMKPFINRGRPATYAYLGGVNAGVIYTSYRMKKSKDPAIRSLWWVIPASVITAQVVYGSVTLRVILR